MKYVQYLEEISKIDSLEDSIKYIHDNFLNIQHVYYSTSYVEHQQSTIQVTNYFFDFVENKLFNDDCQHIIAFIELLADFFERYKCVSPLVQIENYLSEKNPLKKRVKAALLFLKVNNANTDYLNRFDTILNLLIEAQEEGEFSFKSTITFINFYSTAILSFQRLRRKDLCQQFIELINSKKNEYIFLRDSIIEQLYEVSLDNFKDGLIDFYSNLSSFLTSKLNLNVSKEILEPEQSSYSNNLTSLEIRNFVAIRGLSIDYMNTLSSYQKKYLKDKLDNGLKIIDEYELLYVYMYAYGKMHFSKIEEATKKISKNIKNQVIEIYDWGCGQALASMVFLETIKKMDINPIIKCLNLIEPSEIALKRGIAHVNCICPQINLKSISPICCDLDSVSTKYLSNNPILKIHLLSNIIDIPFFNLNLFCDKLTSLKGMNIFICVSPVLYDTNRSIRLPMFLEYFYKRFESQVISETKNTKVKDKWKSNNCPCPNHNNQNYYCKDAWTRHEIIFTSSIV